jgi:hypothetical protein
MGTYTYSSSHEENKYNNKTTPETKTKFTQNKRA